MVQREVRAIVGKRRTLIKGASLALLDVSSWVMATLLLVGARYDFQLSSANWSSVWLCTITAAMVHLAIGSVGKLYQGRCRVGSFEEATFLALAVGTEGVGLGVLFSFSAVGLPRGLLFTVPMGALVLMAAGRFVMRAGMLWRDKRHVAEVHEKVLIYGAGNAGRQLGRLLMFDPDAPYQVMGYIDDDPEKRNLRLAVGKVVGSGHDLLAQARKLGVETIIMAIPTASTEFVRELTEKLEDAGLKMLVLPPVKEMVGGKVTLEQLRELDINDLLGRGQVRTNLKQIAGYLNDKVVLITGAGGSIGSELARQVHTFGPKELVLLDRDESGLHAVQLSIYNQGLLNTRDMVLCDIRDAEALEKVFADHKPDVVFHAAALKHLPMLEMYPDEGWKTNVLGTLNVLECAAQHGVRHFVNISTDKAADPTSVLGKTKRRAEGLTSWFAQQGHGIYLSVRFGNVLGSRGSVLHTFTKQIEQGGPVTIVHPEVTRFFMTIPEACQLVIQAGAIGKPGDVLVLDMGEPVRIEDVAKRLIKQSGKQIDIVYTGLRPGEKLDEVLFSEHEHAVRLSHPLISQVQVPALSPGRVRGKQHFEEDTVSMNIRGQLSLVVNE